MARGARRGPRGAGSAADRGLLLLPPLRGRFTRSVGWWLPPRPLLPGRTPRLPLPHRVRSPRCWRLLPTPREGGWAGATPAPLPPVPVAAALSSAPVENVSSCRRCLREAAVRGGAQRRRSSGATGCGCCCAVSARCTILPQRRCATREPRGRRGSALCPAATGGRLPAALRRVCCRTELKPLSSKDEVKKKKKDSLHLDKEEGWKGKGEREREEKES